MGSFSPLAGINYVETPVVFSRPKLVKERFSPLAGINYVETVDPKKSQDFSEFGFQSPCGD